MDEVIILPMQKKLLRIFLWIFLGLIALVGLYNLPPIHSRLSWRVDNLRTQVKYYFNPPDEAIFEPSTPVPTSAVSEPTATLTSTPEADIYLHLYPRSRRPLSLRLILRYLVYKMWSI